MTIIAVVVVAIGCALGGIGMAWLLIKACELWTAFWGRFLGR